MVIDDGTTTAVITLRVSDDGSAITEWTARFTELECDGVVSRGIRTIESLESLAISGGKLRADLMGGGKLTGEFTSTTTVAGAIELTVLDPAGSYIPCGTWDWSASQE